MSKSYNEMSPAERVADRIAKNREIERRVKETQSAGGTPTRASKAQKAAAANTLTEFQRIKRESGIDVASDFVRNKVKQA